MPSNILRFPTRPRLVRNEAVDHWLERHRQLMAAAGLANPKRSKPQFLTGDDLAEARRLHAPGLVENRLTSHCRPPTEDDDG